MGFFARGFRMDIASFIRLVRSICISLLRNLALLRAFSMARGAFCAVIRGAAADWTR